MLVYLSVGLRAAEDDSQVFEFADSFYYLGFALSMASLLAALEPFSGNAPDPQQILKRFGLGMFTTLIGVAGRTVLQLFNRLPQETLEAVNQRLLVQTTGFIAGLDDLQRTMITRLDALSKEASEVEETILARLGAHQQGIAVATTELAEQQVSMKGEILKFSRGIAALSARIESLHEGIAGASASLNAVRAAGSELRDLLGGETSTTQPISLIQSLRATTTQVEALRTSLSVDRTSAQAALDEMAGRVAVSSGALQLQMSNAGTSFQELAARVAAAGITPLEAAIARLAVQIEGVATELRVDTGHVRDNGLRPLQAALGEAATEAKRFNALLDDMAAAITLKLERLQ
jgi:hypothetical protein